MFRIAQEALTNSRKYPHPGLVRVSLHIDVGCLLLEVRDWGRGFNVDSLPGKTRQFGLTGMRERAALLGGMLTVESQPGEGTQITARIPLYAVEEK